MVHPMQAMQFRQGVRKGEQDKQTGERRLLGNVVKDVERLQVGSDTLNSLGSDLGVKVKHLIAPFGGLVGDDTVVGIGLFRGHRAIVKASGWTGCTGSVDVE